MPAEALPAARPRWPRIVLLVLFVALVCARMPDIVLQGRFWAEEGRYFFHDAYVMPWWHAVFEPVGGYLNIVANLAGVLAHHLVPLRQAPFVTMTIAMMCQACPILVLLTARDLWLRQAAMLLAATLILATPVASGEVWLNSIHSQFHLGLANALILALEPTDGAIGLFRLFLLLLGPLAGPASLFLLPLFGLRFLIERQAARLSQLMTLAGSSAVQFLCFYMPSANRSYGIGPVTFTCVLFEKHLVLPLLGQHAARPIGDHLHDLMVEGITPVVPLLLMTLTTIIFLCATLRSHIAATRWLVLCAMLIEASSDYGAIDGQTNLLWASFGERYAFIPSVLLSIAILSLAADRRRCVTAAISAVLVFWIIAVGIRDEVSGQDAAFAHGPNWARSVRAWRLDLSQPLPIWPLGWNMIVPIPSPEASRRTP